MSMLIRRFSAVLGLPLLVACATLPTGPSVMVLPGSGKNFDIFRNDDYVCRLYAQGQMGGESADQAAVSSGLTSAAVGTALGAATGAAFGGGSGAAVGAGAGLLGGSIVGTGTAADSGYASQQAYDNAYIQCMYGKGHKVPVSGQFADQLQNNANQSPDLPAPPPPPPGTPPPPPPN